MSQDGKRAGQVIKAEYIGAGVVSGKVEGNRTAGATINVNNPGLHYLIVHRKHHLVAAGQITGIVHQGSDGYHLSGLDLGRGDSERGDGKRRGSRVSHYSKNA